MSPVELIVGLGNSGLRYAGTRHNAGFLFVQSVAERFGAAFRPEPRFFGEVAEGYVDGNRCRLLKPATLMNRSGFAVGAITHFYKYAPEHVLIVHDEIDLPPGVVRLKRGGGAGGHNGLRDIIARLGTQNFVRLRIGVGHPGRADEVVSYVLRRAPAEEQELIEQAIVRSIEVFPLILAGEHERAMNRLHSKRTPEDMGQEEAETPQQRELSANRR